MPPIVRRVIALALLGFAVVQVGCATTGSSTSGTARPAAGSCRPTSPCWPTVSEWRRLRASLVGQLVEAPSPLQPCALDAASAACTTATLDVKNPFFLQDQPGGTESLGWLGAWTAKASAYAVAAETPSDVTAAVKFARAHGLRLAIKGTGHDYLGRSNATDSLLVWTHKMRAVTVQDAFVPRGCSAGETGVPAVSVEAGARWVEAYDQVTVKHHRYVQGGGCTSVGAAGGFLQGGGFGSWSRKYGMAAAGMLEAEVVTANGELVVANRCQNQDLFWALRGGGGGTFGVVTKVTLMTHPLPSTFGFVSGSIKAVTDAAFEDLLQHFLGFYGERLNNEAWGEQVKVKGDNSLQVSMAFEGMTADEAKQVWAPFRQWVELHPDAMSIHLNAVALPAEWMWNPALLGRQPGVIEKDRRPGEPGSLFWWTGDGEQAATYWYTYQSRWIPIERVQGPEASRFARVLFDASRQWDVELHFNKGQSGASAEALQRDRETSVNPAVYSAAALAIVAAHGTGQPGVHGREPDVAEGQADKARVAAAMKIIREATPGAGSYVNETDYFEPDWQRTFWGENYERLLAIKRKYDPDGVFVCHHCVGSEGARDERDR
jgi:FAD/FMN-containing dehydrogenase